MLTRLLNKLLNLFRNTKKQSHTSPRYEIVETKLDDPQEELYRSAIRIKFGKYDRVIVSVSPKIQLKEVDGYLHVIFDHKIEFSPPNIQIDSKELKQVVGSIVCDMIEKDYNAFRTTDPEYSSQE